MPKKIHIQDNQRVDLADFEHAANDYTFESVSSIYKNLIGKNYPAVARGFLVEISPTTAGEVTIHNGFGYDKDGRVLIDEDGASVSASVTLGASNTYYLEVEYVEAASDTDYRAFWDSSVTQTPPVPNGEEVALTVATRITPKWRIVSPVSTTGFEIETNPNSTRIPVAVLTTDGSSEITAAVNHFSALLPPATTLAKDVASSATEIKVFSSLNILTSDTILIEAQDGGLSETVAITTNDTGNGVITLAAPLTNAYEAGARVSVFGGTAVFLPRNPNPNDPDVTNPVAADRVNDQIPRLFQGDELRGSAIVRSAQVLGTRDDIALETVKDYVDFMSAQLREMKFGNLRPNTLDATPPAAPSADRRYFDSAGSIMGARGYSFSIGDGINSFGDFNGTDETPFVNALAALPSAGGSILVKRGTYTVDACVIDKPVRFVGEQSSAVFINPGASTQMFVLNSVLPIDGKADLEFENLSLGDNPASFVLFCDNSAGAVARTILVRNCAVIGLWYFDPTGTNLTSIKLDAFDSFFANTTFGGVSNTLFTGQFHGCFFYDSYLTLPGSNVRVERSVIYHDTASDPWITLRDADSSCSLVGCSIENNTGMAIVGCATQAKRVLLQDLNVVSEVSLSGSDYVFASLDCSDSVIVRDCVFGTNISAHSGTYTARSLTLTSNSSVENCTFFTTANTAAHAAYSTDVYLSELTGTPASVVVRGVRSDSPAAIRVDAALTGTKRPHLVVDQCAFDNGAHTTVVYEPIYALGASEVDLMVSSCIFNVAGVTSYSKLIRLDGGGSADGHKVRVTNCVFAGDGASNVTAVYTDTIGTYQIVGANITGLSSQYAIYGEDFYNFTVRDTVIKDTTAEFAGACYGIYLTAAASASGCAITGSEIRDITLGASATSYTGIYANAGSIAEATENNLVIEGAQLIRGVMLTTFATTGSSVASRNRLYIKSTAAVGGGIDARGIYVTSTKSAAASDNYVKVITTVGSTAGSVYQSYCLAIGTGVDDVVISNNRLEVGGTVTDNSGGVAIRTGLAAGALGSVTIQGNVISGLYADVATASTSYQDFLVSLYGIARLAFTGNTITTDSDSAEQLLFVSTCEYATISSNVVQFYNLGLTAAGVYFDAITAGSVTGNTIYEVTGAHKTTFTASAGAKLTVTGNTFRNGDDGGGVNSAVLATTPVHTTLTNVATYNYDNGL